MTQVRRSYGGITADERRGARRRLLLEGVLDVVGRTGVAGVTVGAVCEAAGLTKRYFYESFAGLDDALVAVLDDAFTDLRDRMTAATRSPGGSGRDRAQRVVEVLVDALGANPPLARLYAEAPSNPALRARREAAVSEFTELLTSAALRIRPEDRAPPTVRETLAVRLVVAGATDLVSGWLAGTLEADREQIVAAVLAAGLAVPLDDRP